MATIQSRGAVEETRLEAKDTKKFMVKNSPFEDRPFRGQGQECSRPRTKNTDANVFSKKEKKVFKNFFQAISIKRKVFKQNFQAISNKKVFKIFFPAIYKILTIQKIVLSSSRRQDNFKQLEALRPRPKTWPSRPRTSKCVLKDSISDTKANYWEW